MKPSSVSPLIKTALVAVIVGVIGWFGFEASPTVVEEAVDEYVLPVFTADATPESISGFVEMVIDGDTIQVRADGRQERVRIIGIDTPEVDGSPAGAQCYGAEASERLKTALSRQTVTLETDPTQDSRDEYGRLLAYVATPSGLDVGLALLEEGYAREFTYREPYRRQQSYQAAAANAAAAERGLWAACQ